MFNSRKSQLSIPLNVTPRLAPRISCRPFNCLLKAFCPARTYSEQPKRINNSGPRNRQEKRPSYLFNKSFCQHPLLLQKFGFAARCATKFGLSRHFQVKSDGYLTNSSSIFCSLFFFTNLFYWSFYGVQKVQIAVGSPHDLVFSSLSFHLLPFWSCRPPVLHLFFFPFPLRCNRIIIGNWIGIC